MHPFIEVFSHKIPLYGLCISIGILFAAFLARFIINHEKKNYDDFIIYAAVLFGTGILGAKLLYIFISFPPEEIPGQLLFLVTDIKKSSAGFVFYGGVISGAFGLLISRSITKKPVMDFLSTSQIISIIFFIVVIFANIIISLNENKKANMC